MSLLGSIYNSMSGLDGYSKALDNLSSNVGNVNTVGYKGNSLQFRDVIESESSMDDLNNPRGAGVEVAGQSTDFSQGDLQASQSSTDVAIEGNGFFVLRDGEDVYLTRGGQFRFDDKNVLIDSLTGFKVSALVDGVLTDLSLDANLVSAAKPTGKIQLAGSLNASAAADTKYPDGQDTPLRLTIVDAGGKEVIVSAQFTKLTERKWKLEIKDDKGSVLAGSHVIDFSGLGSPIAGSDTETISFQPFKLIEQADLRQNFKVEGPATFSAGGSGTSSIFAITLGDASVIAREEGSVTLSSAKDYQFDGNGYLKDVATGNKVLAQSDTGVLSDFFVGDAKTLPSVATSQVNVSGTFDGTTPIGGVYPPSSSDAFQFALIDSSGNDVNVSGRFLRETDTRWTLQAKNAAGTNLISSGALIFDATGVLDSVSTFLQFGYASSGVNNSTVSLRFTGTGGSPAVSVKNQVDEPLNLVKKDGLKAGNLTQVSFDADGKATLTYDNGETRAGQKIAVGRQDGAKIENVVIDMTQLNSLSGSASRISVQSSDGYSQGQIVSTSFDRDGTLKLKYSNGQSTDAAKLAIGTVGDTSRLVPRGGALFQAALGQDVNYGVGNAGGNGVINGGKLELSNVEISSEFANIIIVQRGYQASSQVLRVTSDMIEELYNSVRGR